MGVHNKSQAGDTPFMKLTDAAIRNAKPKAKPYKLSDGGGMFLYIHPNGSRYWRLKYRFTGKEKLLALGVYPETGLAQAREGRLEARKILVKGGDPIEAKKEVKRQLLLKSENSFETVAHEWFETKKIAWTARYATYMLSRLEKDIFPKLGSRPIADITAPELLSVLKAIEKRGALEIAQRAAQTCSQIFMYAIITCRAERNPAQDLRGALKSPAKKNYAHLKAMELPEFLKKVETYDGSLQTKLALKLMMLTFVRTTELRGATWSEINMEKAEWHIPAERMKMRRGHIVPLSRQAIEVLQALQPITGHWKYVFPCQNKPLKCMSENTILFAIYRMGYHKRTTGHGFRHTASTILNESGLFKGDAIERQLAHVQGNKVRAAYNHAEYLPERRKMMQWWADYLGAVV